MINYKVTPIVTEVILKREYTFMYENFVILTQNACYLLLEKQNDQIYVLLFDSPYSKYCGPNDEAHGGHPLTKYGLGFYGLYRVENSPWIQEIATANNVHEKPKDSIYKDYKHYIACFKDIKFESVCKNMVEMVMSKQELEQLINTELLNLETNR